MLHYKLHRHVGMMLGYLARASLSILWILLPIPLLQSDIVIRWEVCAHTFTAKRYTWSVPSGSGQKIGSKRNGVKNNITIFTIPEFYPSMISFDLALKQPIRRTRGIHFPNKLLFMKCQNPSHQFTFQSLISIQHLELQKNWYEVEHVLLYAFFPNHC